MKSEPTPYQKNRAAELLAILFSGGRHVYKWKENVKQEALEARDLIEAAGYPRQDISSCSACYRRMISDLQMLAWGYRKYPV